MSRHLHVHEDGAVELRVGAVRVRGFATCARCERELAIDLGPPPNGPVRLVCECGVGLELRPHVARPSPVPE